MLREDYINKKADRSAWKSGPWDNEPDFHEWITRAGYPAWAARLESGAWFTAVEAPSPKCGPENSSLVLAFHHTMDAKYRNKIVFGPGMSYIKEEGITGFVCSMEHWECPGPNKYRDWFRGPYKTLEDTKEICEVVADAILETHQEDKYPNYFNRFPEE